MKYHRKNDPLPKTSFLSQFGANTVDSLFSSSSSPSHPKCWALMNKPLRQSPGVHPGRASMCATESSICLAVLCIHVPETAGLAALHELPTLQIAPQHEPCSDACIAASANSTTFSWYSCQSCNTYQLQGPWRHGRPDSFAFEAVGQLFVCIPHCRRIWRLRVS